MVVDLCEDESGELTLGKRFVFVKSLTVYAGSASSEGERTGTMEGLHLAKRRSDLGPDGINIVVERLESEDLELGFLLGEEGEDARRRHQPRHGCRVCGERVGAQSWRLRIDE
jgi:hypothetical protein